MLPSNAGLVVKNGQIYVRFEFNAQGGVDVHSNTPVSVYGTVGSDAPLVRVPQIGEEVVGGWKYGGLSAIANRPLFVAPVDEPVAKAWVEAVRDASALKGFLGHNGSKQQVENDLRNALEKGTHDHGVRLPTTHELNKNLFVNRDVIGGFNKTGAGPAGRYWSSTSGSVNGARDQNFESGYRGWQDKIHPASIRLVRS